MELDDLKKTWQQADNTQKPQNPDIMQILQNRSYGPIPELKKAFKKQMILMIIVPALIIMTNVDDIHKAFTNVLFWSYIVFCIGLCIFFYFNYLLVKKMESSDGIVKSNLEQQISILETRLKWHIIGIRLVLLFFIALTEVLPYFQHARMLDKWHSLSPFIRFSAYAFLLALQYFITRTLPQKKFGKHLAYLKELVKEMQ